MPISIPIPQIIKRKLDKGRAKLGECTPLVLLHKRLADAEAGVSAPTSDDRLSLPMLLDRYGRWRTALMCGAVEEIALNVFIYKNGPVPVCEVSLPHARLAAQKVVLTACNLLLSTSNDLADRGVDTVNFVKKQSVLVRKVAHALPFPLPAVSVIHSVDKALSNKRKVKEAIQYFLAARVCMPAFGAHAFVFDSADNLLHWHSILHTTHSEPLSKLKLRSAIRAIPGRAKLAVKRAWTSASVLALCYTLAHASALGMAVSVLTEEVDSEKEQLQLQDDAVAQAKEQPKSEEYVVKVQEDTVVFTKKEQLNVQEDAPATANGETATPEVKVQQVVKEQDTDTSSATPVAESSTNPAPCDTQTDFDTSSVGKATAKFDGTFLAKKNLLKGASFLTSNGNKYRIKPVSPSTARYKADLAEQVKAAARGKIFSVAVRIPEERIKEGAKVVAVESKGTSSKRSRDAPDDAGVEATTKVDENGRKRRKIKKRSKAEATTGNETGDPKQDISAQASTSKESKAPETPAEKQAVQDGTEKRTLGRRAVETFGRMSIRLAAKAATMLPENVVAVGKDMIMVLDEKLGLQTYYQWEEGPALIGPWGSQGRWALVADNLPPPSRPVAEEGEVAKSSGQSSSSDVVQSAQNASERKDKGKGAASDPTLAESSARGASVESPATETICSNAKTSTGEKSEANEDTDAAERQGGESGAKRDPKSPFRIPFDYYPRPRLSWFALQAGLQSVRDVIKSVRGGTAGLWDTAEEKNGAGEGGSGSTEKNTHEKSEGESLARQPQMDKESLVEEKESDASSAACAKEDSGDHEAVKVSITAGGSRMVRHVSNSSDVTLVGAEMESEGKGRAVDRGEKTAGLLTPTVSEDGYTAENEGASGSTGDSEGVEE